jgi:hypothetical protein
MEGFVRGSQLLTISSRLSVVRDPVAVGDFADEEAALAEMAVVHGGSAPKWRTCFAALRITATS